MQLYDGRDEAQTQACSVGISAFVGSVEASHDHVPFVISYPLPRVRDPNDVFVFATGQGKIDTSARGRELDRIVDQIRHCLEQEVAVAIGSCVTRGGDPQRNVLVFRDRVVEIPDFPHEVRQRDFGKAGFAPAVLDLGDPQQCGYDRQRLIEG